MKYSRPELTLLGQATGVVRGSKGLGTPVDITHVFRTTANAYEADE
jgi:hypothetical protein